jgi:Ca2+-binding EF-hand superfamily protein
MKKLLGEDVDDTFIHNIIEDADEDCTGRMSIKEFTQVMQKLMRGSESV